MKRLKTFAVFTLFAAATSLGMVGCKSDSQERSGDSDSRTAARPYPLSKCLVSGEPLKSGTTYRFVRDGQEIKLCCKECLADFNKNPEKYLAKLDGAK